MAKDGEAIMPGIVAWGRGAITRRGLAQGEQLARFYIEQHNAVIPHCAFRGQTPDEMYFGKGAGVFETLEAKRVEARRKRLEANRAMRCHVCAGAS